MRAVALALWVLSSSTWAGLQVPLDISAGPAGYWWFGPLVANRGGVPHFALHLDVYAVLDRAFIQANLSRVPPQYQGLAAGIEELKVGPSLFIPSALIISPAIGPLGGVGMYGASWTPLGLTLFSSKSQARSAREASGGSKFSLDAKLVLTYLFIHSTVPEVPAVTHFLRPGVQLTASFLVQVTEKFFISLGGGGQAYVPQRLGEFGFGPFEEMLCFNAFAFLKFHGRTTYDLGG